MLAQSQVSISSRTRTVSFQKTHPTVVSFQQAARTHAVILSTQTQQTFRESQVRSCSSSPSSRFHSQSVQLLSDKLSNLSLHPPALPAPSPQIIVTSRQIVRQNKFNGNQQISCQIHPSNSRVLLRNPAQFPKTGHQSFSPSVRIITQSRLVTENELSQNNHKLPLQPPKIPSSTIQLSQKVISTPITPSNFITQPTLVFKQSSCTMQNPSIQRTHSLSLNKSIQFPQQQPQQKPLTIILPAPPSSFFVKSSAQLACSSVSQQFTQPSISPNPLHTLQHSSSYNSVNIPSLSSAQYTCNYSSLQSSVLSVQRDISPQADILQFSKPLTGAQILSLRSQAQRSITPSQSQLKQARISDFNRQNRQFGTDIVFSGTEKTENLCNLSSPFLTNTTREQQPTPTGKLEIQHILPFEFNELNCTTSPTPMNSESKPSSFRKQTQSPPAFKDKINPYEHMSYISAEQNSQNISIQDVLPETSSTPLRTSNEKQNGRCYAEINYDFVHEKNVNLSSEKTETKEQQIIQEKANDSSSILELSKQQLQTAIDIECDMIMQKIQLIKASKSNTVSLESSPVNQSKQLRIIAAQIENNQQFIEKLLETQRKQQQNSPRNNILPSKNTFSALKNHSDAAALQEDKFFFEANSFDNSEHPKNKIESNKSSIQKCTEFTNDFIPELGDMGCFAKKESRDTYKNLDNQISVKEFNLPRQQSTQDTQMLEQSNQDEVYQRADGEEVEEEQLTFLSNQQTQQERQKSQENEEQQNYRECVPLQSRSQQDQLQRELNSQVDNQAENGRNEQVRGQRDQLKEEDDNTQLVTQPSYEKNEIKDEEANVLACQNIGQSSQKVDISRKITNENQIEGEKQNQGSLYEEVAISKQIPLKPILQDNPSTESLKYPESQPENSLQVGDILVAQNKTENLILLKMDNSSSSSSESFNFNTEIKPPKTIQMYQQKLETVQSIGDTCKSQEIIDDQSDIIQCIDQLNIEYLEKEATRFQEQMSPELYLSPRNAQHNVSKSMSSSLLSQCKKDNKIRLLRESIIHDVQKVLPQIAESEAKTISNTIYENVFGMLLEKYNIEVADVNNNNNNSQFLSQSTQQQQAPLTQGFLSAEKINCSGSMSPTKKSNLNGFLSQNSAKDHKTIVEHSPTSFGSIVSCFDKNQEPVVVQEIAAATTPKTNTVTFNLKNEINQQQISQMMDNLQKVQDNLSPIKDIGNAVEEILTQNQPKNDMKYAQFKQKYQPSFFKGCISGNSSPSSYILHKNNEDQSQQSSENQYFSNENELCLPSQSKMTNGLSFLGSFPSSQTSRDRRNFDFKQQDISTQTVISSIGNVTQKLRGNSFHDTKNSFSTNKSSLRRSTPENRSNYANNLRKQSFSSNAINIENVLKKQKSKEVLSIPQSLEEGQQTQKSNFAQQYLKKCQGQKRRQQEEKEFERIKNTLIANSKNDAMLLSERNSKSILSKRAQQLTKNPQQQLATPFFSSVPYSNRIAQN